MMHRDLIASILRMVVVIVAVASVAALVVAWQYVVRPIEALSLVRTPPTSDLLDPTEQGLLVLCFVLGAAGILGSFAVLVFWAPRRLGVWWPEVERFQETQRQVEIAQFLGYHLGYSAGDALTLETAVSRVLDLARHGQTERAAFVLANHMNLDETARGEILPEFKWTWDRVEKEVARGAISALILALDSQGRWTGPPSSFRVPTKSPLLKGSVE